ncbi:ATP-binding protein [Candidatus Phycosocius bacilliformis]|nr:ATP-binding protein [Candidatus Phycosocius bacilliformis]
MPDLRAKSADRTISLGFALLITFGLGWAGIIWPNLGTANLALLLLIPVVLAASGGGRVLGLGLAILAGAVFNFVALEPRLTFAIAKSGDLVTLGVYVLVAVVAASVSARLAAAGDRAREDATDSALFSAMTHQLLSASTRELIIEVAVRAVTNCTSFGCAIAETNHDLAPPGSQDEAAARWAIVHRDVTGRGLPLFSDASAIYVAARTGRRALLARIDGAGLPDARLGLVRKIIDEAADALDRIELAARMEADQRKADAQTMRRAIFASIGHDLRTPMTALRAGLEGLSGHDPTQTELLRADALRLERTLHNLLELARLEVNDRLPIVCSIDLTDTIDAAIDALPVTTKDRVHIWIGDETPLIQSDPIMLHHIVVNLLENAAKYSPASSNIEVRAESADGGARLVILDEGPGIDDDVADLFGLFRRGTHGDRAPGLGVGLSVVDAFARALGHIVTVRNRPTGTGAEFVVEFYGEPPKS